MWSSPETTWAARPQRFAHSIQRRIGTIFPQLGKVEIAEVFSGAIGQTVHGMPQVGQLRKGLWVASGFGRQGLNTTAMAGQLIARSILWGDERWRLFSPFELVWAGGRTGRIVGQAVACGSAAAPPPPVHSRVIAKARGRGRASARRGWPKPTARPARGRRANGRRRGGGRCGRRARAVTRRKNAASSSRRRGPITPGLTVAVRQLTRLTLRNISDTAYGSPPARGRRGPRDKVSEFRL